MTAAGPASQKAGRKERLGKGKYQGKGVKGKGAIPKRRKRSSKSNPQKALSPILHQESACFRYSSLKRFPPPTPPAPAEVPEGLTRPAQAIRTTLNASSVEHVTQSSE
jgi:hypothetical protein